MLGVQYDSSSLRGVWGLHFSSLREETVLKMKSDCQAKVLIKYKPPDDVWSKLEINVGFLTFIIHATNIGDWNLDVSSFFTVFAIYFLLAILVKKKDSIVSNKKNASCKCFREKDIYLFRIFYFKPLHSLMFVKLSPPKFYVKTSKC